MKYNPSAQVTIITVTYNSAVILAEMLPSLPENVDVTIVDNASTDDSVAVAAAHGANVLALKSNQGFGIASNIAASMARTPYLLFLNPDTCLADDAIEQLIAAAEKYPHASAFNPKMADGRGRPAFKRRSTLLPRSAWLPRGWPGKDSEVPVLSGAAIFCRRAQFDELTGYDPQIFLFHEDDDISLRFKAMFGPLMYIENAVVTHLQGHSTERTPASAYFRAYLNAGSRLYTMRKYKRWRSFGIELVKSFALFLSPGNFTLRKRAQTIGNFKGVWGAVRAKHDPAHQKFTAPVDPELAASQIV